jgi:hypothetical protein
MDWDDSAVSPPRTGYRFPTGREFVIGHILLTTLFGALAGSYWGLFVWQVWARARS